MKGNKRKDCLLSLLSLQLDRQWGRAHFLCTPWSWAQVLELEPCVLSQLLFHVAAAAAQGEILC